jgi:hypothetical protein
MYLDLQMGFEMDRARREFQKINEDDGLTDADKRQLKDAYIQNYSEPEARDLLKTKLAQRAATEDRAARRHARFHKQPRPTTPGHPDR